ncbi:hypothetical protein [Ruegeria arenilitoris]|uniref:hypothetical protein n=1 Tax=Ruegeria arenilitoris TaxID=1173585 RepID=UPI0014801AEF|nr:hypothetical protein [Ruegeria arenilitoris]
MKKVMIATATVFTLVTSAGMSMAHPSFGHAALGGGELSRPNLSAHLESNETFGTELPVAGLGGADWSAVNGDSEAAINREFEPGLSAVPLGSICSEIPPHQKHHSKYSPCY